MITYSYFTYIRCAKILNLNLYNMGEKKNFVLDTNVVLHDYNCVKNFQENDIYLPIAVLEELDKFKKGNEQINYNAREFVRFLDNITDDGLFTKGTSLGPGKGRLFIPAQMAASKKVREAFPERKPDNDILAVADYLSTSMPDVKTIFVTKDVNLRMKARSLGILVEDYNNDKVDDVKLFDKTNETFENVDPELIDKLYSSREGIEINECDGFKDKVIANECFLMKSDRNSVMVRCDPFTHTLKRVLKTKNYGIEPRNAEQSFAFDVMNDPNIKLVALTGKAGTGKTLLALASALGQCNDFKHILLARPLVSLSNKDIGFLPGSAQEKVAPYMQPLFDNLDVIKNQFAASSQEVKRIDDMQKGEQLSIEALAFIRGRSLNETFCIIDEAQNLTPNEVKTIVTRAGEGTKVVFTGDIQQIDQPYLDSQSNGLVYMIDKMRGQELFAHINLQKGERSALSELASNLL